MKPLLIGEAPSKNEPFPRPIEGRIGRRLADYAGLTFEEFLERTERVNLLDVRQDTAEHGFTFDRAAARERWQAVSQRIQPGQSVLLLGKRVADVIGCVNSYFEPCRDDMIGATFYVVPHPSGINRWHNEPENQEKMREFMRRILAV